MKYIYRIEGLFLVIDFSPTSHQHKSVGGKRSSLSLERPFLVPHVHGGLHIVLALLNMKLSLASLISINMSPAIPLKAIISFFLGEVDQLQQCLCEKAVRPFEKIQLVMGCSRGHGSHLLESGGHVCKCVYTPRQPHIWI